ncbi:MSMEG_0570 family nitrogen starvation response protein [Mycolicibacterium frederiksbergense]|uniref:MSMEG_0570 family nitrogen starvation response protein n=1 Tax=Mycolicibacterium frederiksbergense TaxID=117567 RepID=UPI00265BE2D8|nr:MSMEG_0570 family nitrogen starvation response protein [Mycolicibacterium frederiksbergense]MDO0973353.1 MSMEG_0570 family nitrogen starvation response protein [Mycolicibacterium frederiksbergense]
MPEMTFEVRWPDGSTQRCYSPSLVIHDYLDTGGRYTVGEFVDLSGRALTEASDRVRAKFGFACTSAADTNDRISSAAAGFPTDALIEITAMHPPLERS